MKTSVIIAFDFDGVISDSISVHYHSFLKLMDYYGLKNKPTHEEYLTIMNGDFWTEVEKYGFFKKDKLEIHKVWIGLNHDLFDTIQPFPGMKELFEKAQEKFPCIIVSANSSEVIKTFFNNHSFTISCDISGADLHQSKLHKFLDLKQAYPTSKILFVTDTVSDIKEGLAAEVTCIGVSWGFHSGKMLQAAGAHLVVNTVEELHDALDL